MAWFLLQLPGEEEQLYSSSMACPDCGLDIPKLEPRSFSFNSTYGACAECHGLGSIYDFDAAKVITDWSKPLTDGALGPGGGSQYLNRLLQLAAQRYKIDLSKPFEELSERHQKLLLHGPGRDEAPRTGFHGILAYLRDSLEESKSESYRDWLLNYMSATICPACQGKRLRPESLAVKVGSLSIADFTALPLRRALDAARGFEFSRREALIAERLRREVVERLEFLNSVGLSYLSLDRNAASLSGGEGQRIRLATQIGSRLRGVLYVLDEPSIGLHQRDNQRLIEALKSLRDLGNTVLVVEHDEDTIRHADYVVDLGPGAGKLGGHVVAAGTPQQIMETDISLTGRYLSGELQTISRDAPRPLKGNWITVEGATGHNLKNLTASFPLKCHDGSNRRLGLGQEHLGQRHPLSCPGPGALRLARSAGALQEPSRASRISIRQCVSTSPLSAGRRAPTRPPTPESLPPSATSSPGCRSRANAATSRAVFRSTSPAAAARPARAKASAASR